MFVGVCVRVRVWVWANREKQWGRYITYKFPSTAVKKVDSRTSRTRAQAQAIKPKLRMQMSEILVRMLMLNSQMTGMGSTAKAKSVAMLTAMGCQLLILDSG